MTSTEIKRDSFIRLVLLIAGTFLLAGCEIKESSAQALLRIESTYVYIMDFAMSVAYVSGALFVVKGIFAFKIYGEQRTMYSPQVTIRTPMVYFIVGLGLLYLPNLLSIVNNSVFLQPEIDIQGYKGNVDSWDNVVSAVEGLVQIVGFFAIIRAFFIASVPIPMGGGGGQGGLPKAAVHFFAGLAALNINTVVQIVDNTLSF
jgi:hypothetical protein